ncbi:hypothetical protein BCR42DRAFT_428440 [Absidia repens]|uniref:Uncharacterized protein n=1 Tax=Absidia repens TaxID=90262 RepID=A0A1X2HYA6_9FUNG|nr:hypothetical protein BCR42DRAFT_428440 [Absidia repens]
MSDTAERHKLISSYTDTKHCKLSELVQYQCEVGSTHIECNPFVRLFLSCPGKSAMEVTPEYNESEDGTKTSILPDFGSVGEKKSPPGVTMMENH